VVLSVWIQEGKGVSLKALLKIKHETKGKGDRSRKVIRTERPFYPSNHAYGVVVAGVVMKVMVMMY
jgi:hypothetical protein